MKRLKQWILRACTILCILSTSACLDLREEFWIRDDGSAEAEINCDMPRLPTLVVGGSKGIRSMAEELLAEEDSIDSYEVKVIENGDRISLKVQCQVNDLMDFDRFRKSIQKQEKLHPSVRNMMGEYDIAMDGLSGLSVKRTVSPGEAIPALRWLSKSQTDGHGITKIIHFPHPIKKHNAHECWDDGCTLMWETSLASAASKPIQYEFVMPLPIPWGWIIGGTAALIGLLLWIRHLIKKRASR